MERPHSFDVYSVSEPSMAAPPPSFNSLQMPNVFVIPPEEEQAATPPFLYFDASKAVPMSTTPDLESLDIALDVHQQIANTAPIFQRTNVSEETIVMPRKGRGIPFMSSRDWQSVITREGGTDEDVVEVIKVRKHEGISDASGNKGSSVTRSKTFRVRATQAFRSIKNVGRSSRKPAIQELWNPAQNNVNVKQSLEEPSSMGRNLSKRKSRPLSQIFQFGHSDESTYTAPSEPQSPSPPQSPQVSTHPVLPLGRSLSASSNHTSPISLSPEPVDPRPLSPSPSNYAKQQSSFRKRLSLLELPRLFSSSSVNTSSIAISSTTSQSYPPSPPTPSSEIPEPEVTLQEPSRYTPTSQPPSPNRVLTSFNDDEDGEDEEVDYGEVRTSSLSIVREEDFNDNDLSIEMRLDSLHFDSLSFDANDFTMTPLRDRHGKTSGIAVM